MTASSISTRPVSATRRDVLLSALLMAAAPLLSACGNDDANQRARRAADGKQDIVIGLVWGDLFEGLFHEGADMAVEELNGAGGVLGRRVRTRRADAAGPLNDARNTGLRIAHEMAADPDVLAVVGHSAPETAMPASIVYEEAGILFLNTGVSTKQLNQHNFQMVFSTIPDDDQFAGSIATFASGNGFRRIGVLNTREDWADQAARGFVKAATTLGMTIVTRRSFNHQRENFRNVLADLGASQFDVIFLAADERVAELIVRQSMEMNLGASFLMADLIDIHRFKTKVGDATPMISVPILFNPFSLRPEARDFADRFKARYGKLPDSWAAQAYDAVKMLGHAMESTKSAVPLSVATTLRYTLSWRGVTGRHSFDRGGRIYTKVLDSATLKAGKIEYHASEGGVIEYKEADG